MKKLLIGLSGVAVLALAVILFVNAGTSTEETNKATTEVKADCAKCPTASTCTDAEKAVKTETAVATPACCDKAKSETATAKACPEASGMASANCGACPMSKATPK